MAESIEKTENICNNNMNFEYALRQYFAGNCYFNGKLSYGMSLSESEQEISTSLDNLFAQIKPISKPLYLFHGFEVGINYQDNKWKVGDNVKLNCHLSKTPAFWIAKRFSNHYYFYISQKNQTELPKCYHISWPSMIKNIFYQKFLFCIYPENKYQHASSDIRAPSELLKTNPALFFNEEFEYLSPRNENFKLIDIVYKINFGLPFIYKFYVLVRQD